MSDHDPDTFCPGGLAAEQAWIDEQSAREQTLDEEAEMLFDLAVHRAGEPD